MFDNSPEHCSLAFPHDVPNGLAFEQASGEQLPKVGGDRVCIPLAAADTYGGGGG